MNAFFNLLRSMRFAIAVLCVVAIAATIGSILEQNQSAVVYVSRYGTYWTSLFMLCRLTDVYHAWWFLLLLAFMATSTALCLWQRTPGMWREMRSFRLERSRTSLRRAAHHASFPSAAHAVEALYEHLRSTGFKVRIKTFNGGWVLAGRRGAGRRAGYILVHGAMVLICVGGLVDGNVPLHWRIWRGDVTPAALDVPPAQAPAAARLSRDAGAFRAMITLPRGGSVDDIGTMAQLPAGDGYLVQPLPFGLHLRDFTIDHYPNGQPRDFVSTLEIVDGARRIPVTLRVNQPFTYRGVTLFQSGFDDGGSRVTLRLAGVAQPVSLRVGEAAPLLLAGQPYTLEATELKTINVFARGTAPSGWRGQSKPGEHTVDVGPSLAFRLRDASGQATSFVVYQRALEIDGARWFVQSRGDGAETAYLRLPADAQGTLRGYAGWVQALHDPATRQRAAASLAEGVADPALAKTVRASSAALLERFAAEGLSGIARFVPADAGERERIAGGRLYLDLLERSAARLSPGFPAERTRDALQAYTDSRTGNWPALVELAEVEAVPAAVLQVTRAPGANIVYLGAALLAAGVCAMTFIRERRIWLHWHGGELLLALDANRVTPALDDELAAQRTAIAHLLAIPTKGES